MRVNPFAVIRATVRHLRADGMSDTARICLENVARDCNCLSSLRSWNLEALDRRFDRCFGTETGGIVESDLLELGRSVKKHSTHYQASSPEVFHRLMEALPIRHEEFVFVDLGSGKGRALLMAADYPFRKILGVEASATLHDIAKGNLSVCANPSQRCGNLEVVLSDAVQFPIPDGPVVLYLFNPFGEQPIARLVSNVERSLSRAPRELWIIYLNAEHRHLFERSASLQCVPSLAQFAEEEHAVFRSELSENDV